MDLTNPSPTLPNIYIYIYIKIKYANRFPIKKNTIINIAVLAHTAWTSGLVQLMSKK